MNDSTGITTLANQATNTVCNASFDCAQFPIALLVGSIICDALGLFLLGKWVSKV